jgi:hypothetical protein
MASDRHSEPQIEVGNLRWLGVSLAAIAIIVSALAIVTAVVRRLTILELTLFQVISLSLGLAGSYVFGKYSAHEAARDVIRPHARSAFRRVLSLYAALQRYAVAVEERGAILTQISWDYGGSVPMQHIDAALALLSAQVIEQIGTAGDAMEDWRDLVPDEVERIERRATEATSK